MSQANEPADALLARDSRYVSRPWTGSGEPVPVVEAKDCIVKDATGKEFVDFTAGYFVNQAGHCNPRITRAASEQMGKVTQMSHRHTTIPMIDLAEMLAARAPGRSAKKVFFTTGGSEATEFALRMARQHKKKTDIAYLENAYHGLSLGALACCAAEKYRASAAVPLGDYTYAIKNAYSYRCTCGGDCSTSCLDEVARQLDARPNTAAILAEPIQAVGGIRPSTRWWKRLDQLRRERGILLILDEIQTGLGRTGKMFAAEHYGLEPDIITMGKGLSGGIGSLGAVVATEAVERGFFGGTTPTSAGNAVSAAAGCELIKIIEEDDLCGNAARMGEYLTTKVAALDHPWVGDIRMTGLLGGVELVADRQTKAVLDKDKVAAIKDALHDDGFLLTVSGPHGNCLRLQPPLTIQPKHMDALAASLGRVLNAVRGAAVGRA
jgi:4-aminobutyrate aminotransferase-like enzyme